MGDHRGVEPAAPRVAQDDLRPLAPELLLVSLLALGVVAAQLALRALDDSRLTSWRWVFAGTDPLRLFALTVAAVAAAHLAVRWPLAARRPVPLLVALACAAAACFWRAPETIVDAARYFGEAKHLELGGVGAYLSAWGRALPAWTDLPLVPGLYGVAFRAFGEHRVAVQVLGTLLFAASVVLTHRTGAALAGEDVGRDAAALLLAMPYLLTQVPSMLVDVPTMFFLLLATWATVVAVQRGGAARVLGAGAAVFLAATAKYSAWLLLTVVPVVGLAHRARAPGAVRRAAAVAGLGAALLAAAVALERDVFRAQLALLLGYQAPGLRRWGESYLATFFFQVHPLVAAGALVSAWTALRRRDAAWLVPAWPVALLLVLDVRRIRYWVPALPMLALLAGYGLQAIRPAAARRLAVACAVATSLVVALHGHLRFLERTSAANLQAAGAYLDGLDEPAVEVFTPRRAGAAVNPAVAVPLLDLYTSKPLVHAHEPPPPEALAAARTSPLRFTWEWRSPAYYGADGAAGRGRAAVVVIGDDLDAPPPPELARRLAGLRLARTFAVDEGVFEFRTLVRVYRAEPGP